MTLYLFKTSRQFWLQPDVTNAVEQAWDAARRIAKGVQLTRERQRLSAALQSLDRAARSHCPNPKLISGGDAAAFMSVLPRLGASRLPFCTPDDVSDAPGFVLAPVPFEPSPVAPINSPPAPTALSVSSLPDPRAESGEGSRIFRAISRARLSGRPVALSASRHIEITKALRMHLHQDGHPPFVLRFIYSDGSVSGDIHLCAHRMTDRPESTRTLALGLNSCRHFELDHEVDRYLLRTAEFERQEANSFAEQEAFAYDRMSRLLRHYADEVLGLTVFHSGLEPAAIGAYRAVIDRLVEGQRLIASSVFRPGAREEVQWW